MADSKITALTALTAADPANDMIPIVDVSDTPPASGNTKRISINNLLACSPSATLASATITGALGAAGLNVTGATIPANGVYLGSANNLSFSAASTLAMTLNSTGLGVGGSPVEKLTVAGRALFVSANPDNAALKLQASTGTNSVAINFFNTGGDYFVGVDNSVGGRLYGVPYSLCIGSTGAYPVVIATNNTARLTVDSSGNVGIGVTPSAWASGYKAIQGQIGGFALSNDNSSNNQFRLSSNAYFDTTDNRWEYYGASTATAYEQRAGEHRFFNAISGSANTLIPFTQAMTLDASGNLLVGKTASSSTAVGAELRPSGAIISTLAASTNADFALYTYSTGAGAARFYVGMSGTVFATNTTISAISDQRLKENVQDIDVGLGAILALKPRKFDWKTGKGKDIKGDRGFIAQEFETVFPQLVDEWADPAPEGEAPYKSVRQDLIPVLVKAIQELTARVQTLEAK